MSQTFLPRGLLALAAALALGGPAAAQQIPRMDPAHCVGQPEIRPLQPLAIATSKGPARFMVEFADNDRRREYGLMCRKAVAPDRGMLFDFKAPMDDVAFWMRNTVIPLDIIYIRPDGTVLSIARNVPPLDESPVPAGGRVRAVLELAAGRAAQLGILPGDRIVHRIFPHG
ncbi:MAG: hypothetical protein JWQ29_3350 [Phenylobacterium sp.]|nr:hypothetical protein [Phenylobacterium sp.]